MTEGRNHKTVYLLSISIIPVPYQRRKNVVESAKQKEKMIPWSMLIKTKRMINLDFFILRVF